MTNAEKARPERLFTYEYTVLLLAALFGFANIAVFYGFEAYLARLGIPLAWRGWLLGAEPLAAFCLRPFLSVLITSANALALARAALVGLGLALCAYPLAQGVGSIAAVRLFHGVAFVFLVSAVMALLPRVIPKTMAGRAFGYFSLSSLIPYALVPPLGERLLASLGREDRVYAAFSLLILPALALLGPLGARLRQRGQAGDADPGRPSLALVRSTLAAAPVRLALAANLCLFLSTTLIFFFIKPFALGLGLADPGLFFTVSTGASLAVRVLAGPYFDRLPKGTVLCCALVGLAACQAGFAVAASGPARLLFLAGGYGLCLGVALPLLNAVMFGCSPPAMRGTTLNLMLFMMDTAYVFGPVAGAAILAGSGYGSLFLTACAAAVAAALLAVPLAVAGRVTTSRP